MIDHFERLDTDVWLPHYLPHWSSRAESAATCTVEDSELRLTIPVEQSRWSWWRPEPQTGHPHEGSTGASTGMDNVVYLHACDSNYRVAVELDWWIA